MYPAVYSFPEDKEPKEQWPAIIMIINQNDEELKKYSNVVYFYDTKVIYTEPIFKVVH